MSLAASLGALSMLGGCINLATQVAFNELPKAGPAPTYVVDKSTPDDYPAKMAGELNDFSCRYGIHHLAVDEFTPPKAQVFATLLAHELPQITSHQVVLNRFDIYDNHRLQSLHKLSQVTGGVASDIARDAAAQNKNVFTFDKLILDADPMVNRHPGMNMVGCDDAHEGEYYPSEVSGGYSAIVTWFSFSVDGKPYMFRTFYQVQVDRTDNEKRSANVKSAISESIHAIAPRIVL
jgi:hypothetical protein